MELQTVIRWIIVAIVLIGAVLLLGVLLNFAGFILGFALKILLVLLLVAIVLRFFGLLNERRG